MSRTIQLTKIHALNWYGYKTSIAVQGNLLIAGVTGSGKSILMDLIQLVLVGDQRLIRFNQSATGDRSDRNLKGYCLGDIKQEENGITQYMRNSAISYVALEFTWPDKKKVETWGLRIEFANATQTQANVTPFLIPKALERSDFLTDPNERHEKFTLDSTEFRARIESWGGRLYAGELETYLTHMAQSPHLNFDRTILRSLLPAAMSFTFLRSFNEFCRHFILPADKLNVDDVRDSYGTFLRYEEDLGLLNDQFGKLKTIQETFIQLMELRRNRALAKYLEAQLRYEHRAEVLASDAQKLTKLEDDFSIEDKRLKQLDELIPRLQEEIKSVAASINETPDGRLYSELKSRIANLAREKQRLEAIGGTLEQALSTRLRNAGSWLKELRALPLELDVASTNAVEIAIETVENGGVSKAAETLSALSTCAEKAAVSAGKMADGDIKRLVEIRQRLGQLRDEIAALKLGRLPFPTHLQDALNNSLHQRGAHLPALPLCKLCEVTDERWRPAIEIAFTRKFALVVESEHYEEAEKIYHRLKVSELGYDLSRESLINPIKALKAKKPVRPGSLAEKLKTNHPVADAVVSQLFGDVICVEQREQLREHDFAILPDGFRQSGAFVERPRFYDGNPFVGKEGLRQQREWKEKQEAELKIDERRLLPLERAIQTLNENCGEYFKVSPSLYQDLAMAKTLPQCKADLQESLAKLNQIDRAKFDELASKQTELEGKLRESDDERTKLLQSEKRIEVRLLKEKVKSVEIELQKLKAKFDQISGEIDISTWLKPIQELRSVTLEKFPSKDVAADEFKELFHQCDRNEGQTWEKLKSERRELAMVHSKFEDLSIESEANDGYDVQLAKLSDSEIPDYTAKAARERKHWEGLFRNQVLDKLQNALRDVRDLLFILNQELRRRPIGNDRYQIRYAQNPDFKIWHELVEANSQAKPDELWFASAEPRIRDAIDHFLKTLTGQPDNVEATRLLDYRHYYEYDMDVEDETGRKTSVDRHSGKFSGGENQSPYFIAILASYLRAYRRYSSRKPEPTLGLVPIDEAFSKLSGERIKDCITALKTFDLQGVLSMSTGNIPYAFDHCDWLIVVSKQEKRVGKKTVIDNIPVSLARTSEEANRIMHR